MHHLLFEGAELTGKSFTIYGVWNFLEQKYNSGENTMDGCTWFNADVGVFGSADGPALVDAYMAIARKLAHKNIIFEKLHLTDFIYSGGAHAEAFARAERALQELDFKLVLTEVAPNQALFEKRLKERLVGMPSYARIAKSPEAYINAQEQYRALAKKSCLPRLTVDNTQLPNDNAKCILRWIGEGM